MKNIYKIILVLLVTSTLGIVASCGNDGGGQRAPWTTSGNLSNPFGSDPSQFGDPTLDEVAYYTMSCVDVRGYENFTSENSFTMDAQNTGTGDTADASSVMVKLATPPSMTTFQSPPDPLVNCVRKEIETMKKGGPRSRMYWEGGDFLYSRESIIEKPNHSEVEVVPFESCEQVKQAKCLIVD